jgi:hypothetical protein
MENFQVDISHPLVSRLFQKVWQGLPAEDRNKLLGDALHVTDNSLVLAYHQKQDPKFSSLTLGCAVSCPTGVRICLFSERLEKHPEDIICAVIAHELAHIFNRDVVRMSHQPTSKMADEDDDEYEDRIEMDADDQAVHWGYKAARGELYWKPIYEALAARGLMNLSEEEEEETSRQQ